jgi:hypothetical protein
MSYLRRIVGLRTDGDQFGFRPADHAGKIAVQVWVFTDALVATPLPGSGKIFVPNPKKALRDIDLETLEPDTMSAAYPKAVRLDRERVCRVDYAGPRGFGYFARRFGGFDAYFFFADESWFHLIVPRASEDDVWALLVETYPGKAEDHRDDFR